MKKKLKQTDAYRLGTEYQFINPIPMGPWTSYSLLNDPIHMSFVLARYKFCARMLSGKKMVLEVGCGDAPGTPIVSEFVDKVIAVDVEKRLIDSDTKRLRDVKNIEFRVHDICKDAPQERFDAVYSIDVIEHLDKKLNIPFMENSVKSLHKHGICIIGTPNIKANKYASERSRVQHINLFSHKSLRDHLARYFNNVFLFSMNDEVVHTGYGNMAHYLFGMGVGVK
ncbi:class I SAM-dependent methyltransferase [Candidatus Gottesmanbacteria bacterium]|nr:class I SAM-dependent methyltransferase [Candidatus Gottesmanbacteria bacterium]